MIDVDVMKHNLTKFRIKTYVTQFCVALYTTCRHLIDQTEGAAEVVRAIAWNAEGRVWSQQQRRI